MIKKYFRLTKPGIIGGNLLTTVAGFIFASKGDFDFVLFAALTVGMSAIIGSACVFNNYIDRNIDAKMKRTQSRALVTGDISIRNAIIFGFILMLIGFASIFFINTQTAILGFIAFINYIVFYGIAKRKTIHGTLVGTISGALPLVAGYTAVTSKIDEVALALFLVMVFWQMPHFYSIAIYRLKDYKAAKIPVLPAVQGIFITKVLITAYIFLFALACVYLFFSAGMSYVYLVSIIIASGIWLKRSFGGFKTQKDRAWAGKMFGFSLNILLIFSFLISIDNFVF